MIEHEPYVPLGAAGFFANLSLAGRDRGDLETRGFDDCHDAASG